MSTADSARNLLQMATTTPANGLMTSETDSVKHSNLKALPILAFSMKIKCKVILSIKLKAKEKSIASTKKTDMSKP